MVGQPSRPFDEEMFDFEHPPVHRRLENGFAVDGFAAVELEASEPFVERTCRNTVQEAVLERGRYRCGERDASTLRVFDAVNEVFFDIALEPPDIVIYPRTSTTPSSLRDVVKLLLDQEPRYAVETIDNPVAGCLPRCP